MECTAANTPLLYRPENCPAIHCSIIYFTLVTFVSASFTDHLVVLQILKLKRIFMNNFNEMEYCNKDFLISFLLLQRRRDVSQTVFHFSTRICCSQNVPHKHYQPQVLLLSTINTFLFLQMKCLKMCFFPCTVYVMTSCLVLELLTKTRLFVLHIFHIMWMEWKFNKNTTNSVKARVLQGANFPQILR